MTATTPIQSVPKTATYLGALGLIPFATAAISMKLGPADTLELSTLVLIGYGAVILSFLGGIAWGRALANDFPHGSLLQSRMLLLSNVPPLLAWTALFMAPATGLLLLMGCFATMLAIDVKLAAQGFYPPWFPKLRVPLTGITIAFLAFARFV